MADISKEQIVLQRMFLKQLDLFCMFKFIVTDDLKIYNEESYKKLLKIINSYKIISLNSKNDFSNNEKIREYFFLSERKHEKNKDTMNTHHFVNGKNDTDIKKKYISDMKNNCSLFSKNLNNKVLFELFKFPKEEEVCNYIKDVCNSTLINEPLRLNVSFKKYDKEKIVEEKKDNNKQKKRNVSPFLSVNENLNKESNKLFCNRTRYTSVVNKNTDSNCNNFVRVDKKGNSTNTLKKRLDESIGSFKGGHSTDASINFKRFILESREVSCCSATINEDSVEESKSNIENLNILNKKQFFLNTNALPKKNHYIENINLTHNGKLSEERPVSDKIMLNEKSVSISNISSNSTIDTYHFSFSNKEDEQSKGSEIKSNVGIDQIKSAMDLSNENDIKEPNIENREYQSFVYRRKRLSNELSIYSYRMFNNENNSAFSFYDDTSLCLNHFRDIHNCLNRDPSGLRKIKIMLKDEIATISISPFYINFDGVRVFDNVCKAFHLSKDDYKRKRLYSVLKLCMNNQNALNTLKNIFLNDLNIQQKNYNKELCEKKVAKKNYKRKHFRKMSTLRKKKRSEEQICEILNEEKRINVMYFINRFLYSKKIPLSYLFENHSLAENSDKKKDIVVDSDEEFSFDELTIDYFIFLMILEKKIEKNFYKYLIKKIEQCKKFSFIDLTKIQKHKENEIRRNGVNPFLSTEEEVFCDCEESQKNDK